MTQIRTYPQGDTIKIDRAHVRAVRADFVKQEVRITISLPLNDESLAMRHQLAALAIDPDEHLVAVEIQPLQLRLFREEEQMSLEVRTLGAGGEILGR